MSPDFDSSEDSLRAIYEAVNGNTWARKKPGEIQLNDRIPPPSAARSFADRILDGAGAFRVIQDDPPGRGNWFANSLQDVIDSTRHMNARMGNKSGFDRIVPLRRLVTGSAYSVNLSPPA